MSVRLAALVVATAATTELVAVPVALADGRTGAPVTFDFPGAQNLVDVLPAVGSLSARSTFVPAQAACSTNASICGRLARTDVRLPTR